MVCGTGVACLHSGTKEVFYSAEDERGMVDSVDLSSQERGGELV